MRFGLERRRKDVLSQGSIHVTIATKDLAGGRRWYEEKLGWVPIAEATGALIYRVDGRLHLLYETEYAGTAQNTVAGMAVADLRAETARLRARGVTFEEYDFGPDGRTVGGILTEGESDVNAWFTDSEGNILALAEDPA